MKTPDEVERKLQDLENEFAQPGLKRGRYLVLYNRIAALKWVTGELPDIEETW